MRERHDRTTDLHAALEAELAATRHARAARHHVDEMIAHAVATGISYDSIARAALKMRLGRAPSAKQRVREANRLRQRRWRFVTGGNVNTISTVLGSAPAHVGSPSKEVPMPERLIRRKTEVTEEEFEVTDHNEDGADEEEDEDEDEKD